MFNFLQIGNGAKGYFVSTGGELYQVDLSIKNEQNVKKVINLNQQSIKKKIHLAVVGDHHVCILGDEVDGDGAIISVVNVEHGIMVVSKVKYNSFKTARI